MNRRKVLSLLAAPLLATLPAIAARAAKGGHGGGHGGPGGGHGHPKGSVVNGVVSQLSDTGFVVHSHGHGPNGYDVTVTTTTSTVYQKGGTAGQLSDVVVGVAVQVKGAVDDTGAVVADRVLIKGAGGDGGDDHEVSGTVASVGTDSFVVHPKAKHGVQPPDVTVLVTDTTVYKKGDAAGSASDVVVGAQVEVSGTPDPSGNLVATQVKIEVPDGGDGGDDAEVNGTVASLNSSGFVVHPQAKHGVQPPDVNVVTDANTVFTKGDGSAGTLADVTVGASVEVRGTIDSSSGSLLATGVKIESESEDD